jgi:hypothetical protein
LPLSWELFTETDQNNDNEFQEYAKKHLVLCVMDDMQSKDFPIEYNADGHPKPFWGMKKVTYPLYDANGMKSNKAKDRILSSIEALNPYAEETRFEPEYANITESEADNYFKLGFVGAYISNRKTEGFSDLNLHTVISICNFSGQRLNGPDKLLQALGRNRGLDETIEPLFIHAIGHGQFSSFDLKNLDKDNYFKEYFQGMNIFCEPYLKLLGVRLAQNIISEYYKSKSNESVEIDSNLEIGAIEKKILHMIAENLRQINSLNNHEIKLSRLHLRIVLTQTQKCLVEHIESIENPHRLSRFVAFLGYLMNVITSTIFWFIQRIRLSQLNAAINTNNQTKNQYDKIYQKILTKTSYKQLAKKSFVAAEARALLNHQRAVIRNCISKEPKKYLKEELQNTILSYEKSTFVPFLLKFVKEDYQDTVKSALQNHPDLLGFLDRNKHVFKKLSQENLIEIEVKKLLIQIFQQFPETQNCDASNFVDAINLVRMITQKIKVGPVQILSDEVCKQISEGLHSDFINQIQKNMVPFLMPEDIAKLKNGLTKEVGQNFFRSVLIGHRQFLLGEENGIDINDTMKLFENFNKALGNDSIQNPLELAKKYEKIMIELRTKIQSSPVEAMNQKSFSQLKNHFKESLIPSMINLSPFDKREEIQKKITDESIEKFLQNDLLTLQKMKKNDDTPEKIANFVLSKLTNTTIDCSQSPITIQQQVRESIQLLFASVFLMELLSLQIGQEFTEQMRINFVSNLILNKNFLQAFSTLVSFEHYQKFDKKLSEDPGMAVKIATDLLNIEEDRRSLQNLVSVISNASEIEMEFISEKAENAQNEMTKMFEQINENPSNILKPELIKELTQPTKEILIPLLAKYIQNDTLRETFIDSCKSIEDAKLFDFMFRNQKLFQNVQSENFEDIQESLILIFNGLKEMSYPKYLIEGFSSSHLRNLKAALTENQDNLKKMIELEAIEQYLITTDFIDILQLAYNETDFQDIINALHEPRKRKQLAKNLQKQSDDINQIDDLFKKIDLNVIQLDKRLNEYKDFLEKTKEATQSLDNFSKEKLKLLIKDELLKILTEPFIKEEFSLTIGLFEQEELQLLLKAIYGEATPISAKDLISFYNNLQNNQIDDSNIELNDNNLSDLKNFKIFEVALKVHEEMIKCHCFFNQHGMRGEAVIEDTNSVSNCVRADDIKPQIFNKLSLNVQKIKMNLSDVTRRMLYLRSVQKAFPEANELHLRTCEAEIIHIQQFKDDVIEPIKQKSGASVFDSALVNFRDIINSIYKYFFENSPVMNHAPKKGVNEFVRQINLLEKLKREDARKEDSVMEVVDTLSNSPKNEAVHSQKIPPSVYQVSLFKSSENLRKKIMDENLDNTKLGPKV